MATTAELRALLRELGGGLQFGHVLLIDGIETSFTDHSDLAGIDTGTGHAVRLGLQREGITLRMSVDLRTGQFNDSPTKFTIVDFSSEGDLAQLFAAIDPSERPLTDVPVGAGTDISPSEDLSSRTELHGRHIGTECIGSAGERHQFPCIPGFTIGLEHRIASPALTLAASPVSERPIVWAGRRWALYRVYYDHILGSWRPFSEARRISWGTLRDQGTVSGHEWTFDADGPESWLRRTLGVGYQTDPVRAVGDITLTAEESGIAGELFILNGNGIIENYGAREFVGTISGTTVAEIRQSVIDEIAAIAAATGADGEWENVPSFHVAMDENGSIRISVDAGTLGIGVLQLCMHATVWAICGYDLAVQDALDNDEDEPTAISNASLVDGIGSYSNSVPGPGYWKAQFWTGQSDWPLGMNNAGATRVYRPLYLGGTHLLRAELGGGQVVRLADATLGGGASQSTVAHPGQLDRPPASSPSDITAPFDITGTGEVDHQGLFLFYGKRRMTGSDEEFDEYQVARCSWVAGQASQSGLISGDTIVVTEWLDPRRFGFDRPILDTDWVARADAVSDESILAVPILSLAYLSGSSLEPAHIVLQRLLLSTGTSDGWSSLASDPSAAIDTGDNEPSDPHTVARDAEVAALGLGIPSEMVASIPAWGGEADLVDQNDVLDVKVAFSPGMQSEDLLQALTQPIGWCWHLRGGRYGVFCPAHSLTLADATAVIDRSNKAISFGRPVRTKQELRAFSPIDKFSFEFSWAPHENKLAKKTEHLSSDAGTRYRNGGQAYRCVGHGHRDSTEWRVRTDVLARWWARRHFWVRAFPIFAIGIGEDIWPGTVVRFTDPECIDPAGFYGVENRIAIVTSTNEDVGKGTKVIDLLVLADESLTPLLHAPSARGYGVDTDNNRILVRDNWLGIETTDGSTWSDAAHFVEPTYEDIAPFGGGARVFVFQWDGSSWEVTVESTVVGVGTTPGSSYIELSDTTGYFAYRDSIIVLAPPSDQDADVWPLFLYAPIANETGVYGGESYPWEP